jgi:hypothetical protein
MRLEMVECYASQLTLTSEIVVFINAISKDIEPYVCVMGDLVL